MTDENKTPLTPRVRQSIEKLRDTEDEKKRLQRLRSKNLKPTKTSLFHFRGKKNK